MITAEDFKLHPRDPKDRTWTETLFVIFSVPEAGISGSVYTLVRPNIGICHSSIEIHKGFCFHPWQIHHHDAQMHLACPENFDDYTLENGLSFKALDARDSLFKYQSRDGNCTFDLSYKSICDPFDPHDPKDNTLLGRDTGSATVAGYDGWNHGHMEGMGRVTGELTLHEKKYQVDCVDGMDKSWGPRPDWGQKGAVWLHVSLGDDFGVFLVLGLEFEKKEVVYGPFKFGFISLNGKRRSIVSASMKAQRMDMLVTRAVIQFTDDQGESYEALGTTVAGAPWYTFNPASAAFQTLMRFECNGRVGYSHIADFAGSGFLAQGMADHFAD
jgi:hypothetical protein